MSETPAVASKSAVPKRSLKRRVAFALISIAMALLVCGLLCEGVFRIMEAREQSHTTHEGAGGRWFADGRYGWLPSIGTFHQTTSEYDITGNINSLYMNDEPVVPGADDHRTRVMAIGDSHTYAVGVNTDQTWPKVLEKQLNDDDASKPFRVYNTGVMGWNMHQYLLRLIDLGPILKPQYVVLGVSYATDLYDLLPPAHGGWIYGSDSEPRDYFDLDESGKLVPKRYEPPTAATPAAPHITNFSTMARNIAGHFATFRYLHRSKLALIIGSHLKIGGQSLWPNVEVMVEKNVSPAHEYQWKLFEALLDRMKQESDHLHAKFIVVGIPYLPQVYDDVWQSTFGNNPEFSRTAGIERVKAMCDARGIPYVETLDALREKTKETGHWMHFHKDAHPTVEGQAVIADAVFRANLIHPATQPTTQP